MPQMFKPTPESNHRKPSTHANTSHNAKNERPISGTGEDREPETKDKHQHPNHHPKDWWDKATVILLILTFGAAAAVAVFTHSEQEAAWKQVNIAVDTAKKQLRAYVAVAPAGLIPVNEGTITEVPLRIFNSGQTPAYKLAFDVTIFEEQEEKAMSWKWNFPMEREFYKSQLGLLPGETIRTFPVDGGITLDSLVKLGRYMYAVGIVFYDDIYERTHWTKFCIWWDGEHLASEEAATYCDKYNETSRLEK